MVADRQCYEKIRAGGEAEDSRSRVKQRVAYQGQKSGERFGRSFQQGRGRTWVKQSASVVRHRERAPDRNCVRQDLRDPRIFHPKRTANAFRGKYFLEVFAGSCNLCKCMRRHRIRSIAFDHKFGKNSDLLRPSVVRRLSELISSPKCVGVWFAMLCGTLSRARRNFGAGPGPLRGEGGKTLWGLPGLKGKDRARVLAASRLIRIMVKFCKVARQHNTPHFIENPQTSRLWKMRCIHSLLAGPRALATRFDF